MTPAHPTAVPQTQRTARHYYQYSIGYSGLIQAYWILTSVFWVVTADLSATQLILLGTVLEGTVLLSEIPTGVMADASSRKWSVVVSMVIMGVSFFFTGFAEQYEFIVATQVAWGIGWTFSSGADVAWVTDELTHHGASQGDIDRVMTAGARYEQLAAAAGLLVFGLLAWLISTQVIISVTGALMVLLGVYVAVTFSEDGFQRAERGHFMEARRILKTGARLARVNRTILLVLVASVIFNLGAEAVDRLTTKRLIDLGVPPGAEEIAWFTLFGVIGLLAGAVVLKAIEERIEGSGAPRKLYAAAAMVAALGAVVIALAPDFGTGVTGDIVVRGIAWATLPVIGEVWVNREASSDVRATLQSFLGQAESVGEIIGGVGMAVVAAHFGLTRALLVSVAIFILTALLVWFVRPAPHVDTVSQ